MKKLLTLAFLLISLCTFAQEDSTKTDQLVVSVGLSSKNLWRGNVYGNNVPSISGILGARFKGFELGACGTSTVNGNRDGYGMWMELYVAQTIGNFSLTLDDYYFFNAYDSLNDYLTWNKNTTQHLVEARLKYDLGRFNITGSYVVYAATSSVNSFYAEAEFYIIPKTLSVSIGGVFGESYLNFYDKAGVTHFGFTGFRHLKFSKNFSLPIKVAVMTSPNYKNASVYPAFTQNPINFVVGISY